MAAGTPAAVINAQLMREVFEVQVQIINEPVSGTPMCVVEKSTRTHG